MSSFCKLWIGSVLALALAPEAASQVGPRPRRPTGLGVELESGVPELFTLGGRVLYSGRLEPAKRISVKLVTVGGALIAMTYTDERGLFEFLGLSRGVYLVQAAEEGYQPAQERVDLNLGGRSDTVLMLEPTTDTSPRPAGNILSVRELRIPDKAREAFERGARELHDNGKPERSVAHFQRAIELYREYDEAYVQLGLAHAELKQLAEAEEVLRTAIEVNADNGAAYGLLGTLCNQQGKPAEALPLLERALELKRTGWQVEYELGRAHLKLRQFDQALEHTRRAHQLKPEAAAPHLQLYNALIHRQELGAALEQLEAFLEKHPTHPAAAELRKRQEDLRQAVAAAQNQNPR